jgi:methylthioribose-1-phosphate isomerase
MTGMRAIEWDGREFRLLDQTKLPGETVYIATEDWRTIVDAIRRLAVRGAPAIGIAAAFAFAFAARKTAGEAPAAKFDGYVRTLERIAGEIGAARPTAVNLRWALERMKRRLYAESTAGAAAAALLDEAAAIREEDIAMCRMIGEHGWSLLPDRGGVLTHCNTGALATGDHGTAQSVITAAIEKGKRLRVYVDETRPLLQGARLTMYELKARGIDATLITDGTAGSVMQQGRVHAVVTGADRIAANGDTANKVGTYGIAVLARHHGIPMFIAAPTSTIDRECPDGGAIPIEERDPAEVTHPFGVQIAPGGISVYAPAFDVTPAALIEAIVTERGVVRPPYGRNIAALFD